MFTQIFGGGIGGWLSKNNSELQSKHAYYAEMVETSERATMSSASVAGEEHISTYRAVLSNNHDLFLYRQ